jgi:MoxR-like ATPase
MTLYEGKSAGPDAEPYLPDPELIEAVNLAIYLQEPLLIKGEPGSGKTRLARAVANELGYELHVWPVKSTSRARDGLYVYDGLARLRDSQLRAAAGRLTRPARQREDIYRYIRWGPLGKAFRSDRTSVVLIDEIDKADIDFPNDLLLELDEQRFIVEETGEEVVCARSAKPVVIITSNDEKDLPDAFLRRCLFHYIEFPKPAQLVAIVNAHFPGIQEKLVNKAVGRFLQLRDEMTKMGAQSGKKVATSELIEWMKLLNRDAADAMRKLDGELPYPQVLLKSRDDRDRFANRKATP